MGTQEKNIFENNEVKKLMNYLRKIANIVSLQMDDRTKILVQEYEKIRYISNKTVLYNYIKREIKSENKSGEKNEIIFPFGLNNSQMDAVNRAINNKISIIQGPPGTGKTQTILNIIANVIMKNQTVAIVSNNNSATNNVYEKMQKYGLEFLCAKLGKKENKEKFINEQTGKYPKFAEKLYFGEEDILKKKIAKLNEEIPALYEKESRIKKLKIELKELQLEQKYFEQYEQSKLKRNLKLKNLKKISSEDVLKLKTEYNEKKRKNLAIIYKSLIRYGIGECKDYLEKSIDLDLYYSRLFYILKINEVTTEINNLLRELKFELKRKTEILIEISNKLLNEKIRKKYNINDARHIYTEKEISKTSANFNNEYPVILSTTHSIRKCINEEHIFDYVIIDEASQVDLITGILTMSCARNIIIVGDVKQLPNVIKVYDKRTIDKLTKEYGITQNYNYTKQSLLSSVLETLPTVPQTLLKEHYRCHPSIIEFCNKKFYNGELIIQTEDNGENNILKVYKTVPGNHARGHLNQRQIDVITNEIIPELIEKGIESNDIGIISPYREQKEAIMQKEKCSNSVVDTIHKFQGREMEAIILTTVDNQISDFVDNINMINVAISRAKKYLRIVVPYEKQHLNTNISDFIKYVEYNNFEVVNSNVKSIFDLLYKANYKQRVEYLKNKKKFCKIEYLSEKLTYDKIIKVLKEERYVSLDVAVHIPLRNLISIRDDLTERKKEYISNGNTHIDFIIFSKMDKKTILAIETDGYKYHKKGTKQSERDEMKNKILNQYGIELLRLNTTESNEEARIKEKLDKILEI